MLAVPDDTLSATSMYVYEKKKEKEKRRYTRSQYVTALEPFINRLRRCSAAAACIVLFGVLVTLPGNILK